MKDQNILMNNIKVDDKGNLIIFPNCKYGDGDYISLTKEEVLEAYKEAGYNIFTVYSEE